MPFQAVPNVAQVSVQGRQDGQLTINTTYWEISGGGITPVNLLDLATAMDDWASGTLALQLSDDWAYTRTEARDLTVVNGAVAVASTPATGGVSGEANPNNVAACVSFRTAFGGRSFRGRNYVPGIPGTVVTLNTLDNTFMSNILIAYQALMGAGTFLAGWQWVTISRKSNNVVRPTGIATPVTGVIFTRPYVASMRSRAVGHGA